MSIITKSWSLESRMRRPGIGEQKPCDSEGTGGTESSPRVDVRKRTMVPKITSALVSILFLRLIQLVLAILVTYVLLYSSTAEKLSQITVDLQERGEAFFHRIQGGEVGDPSLTGSSIKRRERRLKVFYRGDMPEIPGACVLPQACVDLERTVYLPKELMGHKRILQQTCKLDRFKFYNVDLPEDSFDVDNYKEYNLLGIQHLRWHMPHFYQDFEPSFIALDTIFERREMNIIECYSTESVNGTFCDNDFLNVRNSIKLAIVLAPRLRQIGNNSWVHQFVSFVTSPQDYKFLYSDTLYERSNKFTKVCFNTITVGTISTISSTILKNHRLFGLTGLNKKFPKQISEIQKGKRCKLNITIVNRDPSFENPRNFYGARNILNIKELVKTIKKISENKNIDSSIIVTYLSNKTFLEQVLLMQKSHVLISIHGAELTNQIFLRWKNVLVIEIFPFRYIPNIFADQRFRLGIQSYSTIAYGDSETFKKCLLRYNPLGSDSHIDALKLIKKFKMYTFAYKNKNLNSAYHFPDSYPPMARVCHRTQKLLVDSNEIAKLALKHSEDICQ